MFLAVPCEEGKKSKEVLALTIVNSEQSMVQVPKVDLSFLSSYYLNITSLKVPIAEAESDFDMPENEDDEDEDEDNEEDDIEEQLSQVKSWVWGSVGDMYFPAVAHLCFHSG